MINNQLTAFLILCSLLLSCGPEPKQREPEKEPVEAEIAIPADSSFKEPVVTLWDKVDQNRDGIIQDIREKFKLINSSTHHYDSYLNQMYEDASRDVTESELSFCDAGTIIKTVNKGSTMRLEKGGNFMVEDYFFGGEVFFAFERVVELKYINSYKYDTVGIYDRRYYYYLGELIRWVDEDGSIFDSDLEGTFEKEPALIEYNPIRQCSKSNEVIDGRVCGV
ncbi:MAG: hypothetical protein JKY52_06625 [Flavobacteriales bacterium]|nr:hypothetical protein [Flavobacteriales bacterium]